MVHTIQNAEAKTICQCKNCNDVFEFKDTLKVKNAYGVVNIVCPYCKGNFIVIKGKDYYYLDKFLFVNYDVKYYEYKK